MVDVARMPANAFGSVPTPALVAPIEFTLPLADYIRLGGHIGRVRRLEDVHPDASPAQRDATGWHGLSHRMSAVAALLPDGRLHLQHGPIDCLCQAWGKVGAVDAAYRRAARFFATILDDLCAEISIIRSPLPTTPPRGASHARCMWPACHTLIVSLRQWRQWPGPSPMRSSRR